MTATNRLAIINAARRDNIASRHQVSSPREHAVDLVTILISEVAKGQS